MECNILKEQKNEHVKLENFSEADADQQKLIELEAAIASKREEMEKLGQLVKTTDVHIIEKYLNIAAGLLISPRITSLSPALSTLKQDVIQDHLIHPVEAIRAKALKCYGLFCIIDEKTANIGIHICSMPVSSLLYFFSSDYFHLKFLAALLYLFSCFTTRFDWIKRLN